MGYLKMSNRKTLNRVENHATLMVRPQFLNVIFEMTK
jgi:hypothetical protein